jgi:hypothetical protein
MELKLSDAIKLGAMMKPQGFGRIYDGENTCAFGAAYDAIGILERLCDEFKRGVHPLLSEEGQIRKYYEFTGWRVSRVLCPQCGVSQPFFAITHLNDDHRWSREAIAGWVESLEKQSEIASPESVEQGVAG